MVIFDDLPVYRVLVGARSLGQNVLLVANLKMLLFVQAGRVLRNGQKL
jgi:hypothetical protein